VKQRRTIASIDDLTDENNRPNKRNRTINSWDDDDDDEIGDDVDVDVDDDNIDDGNLSADKANEFIRVCLPVCRGA
jgi:hypothetical protein